MAKIKCGLLTWKHLLWIFEIFMIFFLCVALYLNGRQGERCCFICSLGLAGVQALDVAEMSGCQFLLKLAVSKGIFPFCISPRTILREEFASMCDGCPMQRQTLNVAKLRAAASNYF